MEPRYQGDPISDELFEVSIWEGEDVEDPDLDLRTGAEDMPSLDATWSVLDLEPDMDDIMEKAGESL